MIRLKSKGEDGLILGPTYDLAVATIVTKVLIHT